MIPSLVCSEIGGWYLGVYQIQDLGFGFFAQVLAKPHHSDKIPGRDCPFIRAF